MPIHRHLIRGLLLVLAGTGTPTHAETSNAASPQVSPPAGRLAVVADGNSPDPDDIGATAVMFGLLHRTETRDRLVHLSHSCDLDPFRNRGGQTIDAPNEARRQRKLDELGKEGIALYGPFPNLKRVLNCRTDADAAIADLRDAINASSEEDPLWIVEAGEPDVIGYALEASDPSTHAHVHVVSHHPANDDSGDFFEWEQILAFGVTEHQIGDQNVGLKTPIEAWDWTRDHADPGVRWIRENLRYAEQDGVVTFQSGRFDASDAGMLYWWLTGADEGGNAHASPEDIRRLLTPDETP